MITLRKNEQVSYKNPSFFILPIVFLALILTFLSFTVVNANPKKKSKVRKIGVVVKIKGNAFFDSEYNKKQKPLVINTHLYPGDLVDVKKNSLVCILCINSTIKNRIPEGIHGSKQYCPEIGIGAGQIKKNKRFLIDSKPPDKSINIKRRSHIPSTFILGSNDIEISPLKQIKIISKRIKSLEKIASEDGKIAIVYRALGELYIQDAKLQENESRYYDALSSFKKTLEISNGNKDLEEIAAAQKGMGEAYLALGRLEEAYRSLNKAKNSYLILQDTEKVNFIVEKMGQIMRSAPYLGNK